MNSPESIKAAPRVEQALPSFEQLRAQAEAKPRYFFDQPLEVVEGRDFGPKRTVRDPNVLKEAQRYHSKRNAIIATALIIGGALVGAAVAAGLWFGIPFFIAHNMQFLCVLASAAVVALIVKIFHIIHRSDHPLPPREVSSGRVRTPPSVHQRNGWDS